MRIISGQHKGRALKAPAGIRPTEDRVKKAFFDIIDVADADFCELFAGSGAVGFEALSHGAKSVIFVEKDRQCVRILEANLKGLNKTEAGIRAEVFSMDAQEAIHLLFKKGRKFDILFLDPPYSAGLAEKSLQSLEAYDILNPSGFVCVQHFKKNLLPQDFGAFQLWRQAQYGDTVLSFYKRTQAE